MKQKYWILYCNILSDCTVSFSLCTEFGDLAKKLSSFLKKNDFKISQKKKKNILPELIFWYNFSWNDLFPKFYLGSTVQKYTM